MANPCDKRVQQLTASLASAAKAVDGLNAQVTQQMLELDAAALRVTTAEALLDESAASLLQSQAQVQNLEAWNSELKTAHVQMVQRIEQMAARIAELEGQPPPPPPPPPDQTISPPSGDVNAHVNEPEVGR